MATTIPATSADRYADIKATPKPTADPTSNAQNYTKTTQTQDSTQVQNGTTASNASATRVTTNSNMDAASLSALQSLISALQGGGTAEMKVEAAKRKQAQDLLLALLPSVSTNQAFTDARGLMALNLQKTQEANMPAIQRAIEGAGSSASSAQGLLMQNMARDSALAASALGAEQAKAYASQQTGMMGVLEALTRPNAQSTNALIQALQVAKGATSSATDTSRQSTSGMSSSSLFIPGTTTTETVTPNTPTDITPSNWGAGLDKPASMSWIDAMAASRRTDGNVDWVKAADMIGG